MSDERLDGLSLDDSPLDWALNLGDESRKGVTGTCTADADETKRLTSHLDDGHGLEVLALRCDYQLRPLNAGHDRKRARFEGRFTFEAELRQTCVVTLERITTRAKDSFAQVFSSEPNPFDEEDSGKDSGKDFGKDFGEIGEEPPLPIINNQILFGPLVCEYLALAIDPNPRKPGVSFDETGEGAQGDEKPPSPFADLKKQMEKE